MDYTVCCVILLFVLLVDGSLVPSPPPPPHHKRDTFSLADPAPSSGNQRLLVLTVDYPSQKGKYSGAQWKSDYFSAWNQFYQAQSYNKLQYQVDVVTVNSAGQPVINDPTSVSYIPVQNEVSRYANGGYGWNFQTQWNLHTIVKHASAYLDSKNFSWAPYIQNGKVQNVLIMSAGTDYRYAEGEANAASNYLLSTSYSGSQYRTNNGAVLNSYTFCSEHTQPVGTTPLTMAKLGQCAHEFGHALGIPDLYDVSSQTTGVGYFDLLGYGIYALGNSDGSTPIGYGAYTKSVLGWADPLEITTEGQLELGPSSSDSGNFLKIYPNVSDSSFYYLVENRQAIDKWDMNFVKQYTSGILIWSVNQTNVRQYTLANHINTFPSARLGISNCPPTPSVVLREADGTQHMSSLGYGVNYGGSQDVWQVGSQFLGPNDLAIAVVGQKGNVYSVYVSFLGPISLPDRIKDPNSGSPSRFSSSFILLVLSFLFLVLG